MAKINPSSFVCVHITDKVPITQSVTVPVHWIGEKCVYLLNARYVIVSKQLNCGLNGAD